MTRRIEDYALLSDSTTAALVSRDGSVDWLCLPRFDSPACFASLLGDDNNGTWSIRPKGDFSTDRAYLPGTLVLESIHRTADGSVAVIDAMVPSGDEHRMVRIVEGRSGTVKMTTRLAIRFDYGSIVPWVTSDHDGLHAIGGPDALVLRSDVPLHGENRMSVGEFTISAGQRVGFDLAWHRSTRPAPPRRDTDQLLARAIEWWTNWSGRLAYDGTHRDDVHASLTVLKGLTHDEAGSMVAAPTTSLPEWLGGSRNWDYRYCWLRDATFTLLALMQGGCVSEAQAWRDWLIRAVAGDPSKIQIMYGLAGERRLPEMELDWLDGFAGSRPVRIGNGAADQLQIDVFGEVMDAMHHARLNGMEPDTEAWQIQKAMLEWLEGNWQLPDEGIWEVRGGRAQLTYSKLMAWVAFDRGIRAVDGYGLTGNAPDWRARREEIRKQILEKAVDSRGVFTQSYGSSTLDASTLMIPLVGFLPPTDPRVVATVEAIQQELTVDGFVQRYQASGGSDGVGGEEGTFLLCSFWMVDCLALMGRQAEATAMFERLLSLRNDVGLLAEEYDPISRRQLGNFPQAFSHVAIVGSAVTLCPVTKGMVEARTQIEPDAAPS